MAISEIGPTTRIVGLACRPEEAPGPVPCQAPTAHPAAGLTEGLREAPTAYQPVLGDIEDSAGAREANMRDARSPDALSTTAHTPRGAPRSGGGAGQSPPPLAPPGADRDEGGPP